MPRGNKCSVLRLTRSVYATEKSPWIVTCAASGMRKGEVHANVMLRAVGFLFCELFGEFGRIEDSLPG